MQEYRSFTITGKVLSGNNSHAHHSLFWAIRNSEWDSEIMIDSIEVEGDKDETFPGWDNPTIDEMRLEKIADEFREPQNQEGYEYEDEE